MECKNCHHEYSLREGQEPTPFCDTCAHALLEEALVELEDMVRQHASGLRKGQDVNGGGLSTNRDAIRFLEKVGRLKVTGGQGRCIYGVWNDAEKKA